MFRVLAKAEGGNCRGKESRFRLGGKPLGKRERKGSPLRALLSDKRRGEAVTKKRGEGVFPIIKSQKGET